MPLRNYALNLFRAAGLMALLLVTFSLAQPRRADSLHLKEILTPKTVKEANTLFLQDRMITIFRAPAFGYSPRERVEAIRQRFDALLDQGKPGDVARRMMPEGVLLLIGNQGVFLITPGDLDSLSGETLEEAGKRAAENLSLALRLEREQRSFSFRVRASALLLLTAAILIFLLWGILRGRRYLYQRLQEAAGRRMARGPIKEINVLDADRSLKLIRGLVDGLSWLAGLLLVYLWISFSMRRFPFTRPWGDALRGWLLSLSKQFALAFLEAIPGIITVVLIFLVTRFIVRLVKAFFHAIAEGRIALGLFHPETAQTTRRIFVTVLWLFAFVPAYPLFHDRGPHQAVGRADQSGAGLR